MALPARWLGGLSNILEVSQLQAVQALIVRKWSIRRIARTVGVNRRFPGDPMGARQWLTL
jgi:hypothetical protein